MPIRGPDCLPFDTAEAFKGVAEALDLPPELKYLSALRSWLLPEFYFFFVNCPGKEASRDERMRRLEERRNAATTLLKSGGLSTRTLRQVMAGIAGDDQFEISLRRLANEADEKIQRLRSSRGRAGRPPKNAFRQLGKDLIRVYGEIEGAPSDELDWDRFYRFAASGCRCLRTCLPAVDAALPRSSRALRDDLRQIWKSEVNTQTKNPLRSIPNKSS